jgi:hypothetical protein
MHLDGGSVIYFTQRSLQGCVKIEPGGSESSEVLVVKGDLQGLDLLAQA